MHVLGIETSCDETAISVVKDGNAILSNIVYSQQELHEKFGGVFPELASRNHLTKFLPTLEKALAEANLTLNEIDIIAVATNPGLMGSLLMGVTAAKSLSLSLKKPIVAVNHIEAHLYASMMQAKKKFPSLGLVVSGGHTTLYKIIDETTYLPLSATVDDAVGEAFDKVARLLNLPYPGGPNIEKLAKQGDPSCYPLKESVVKENPFSFSYSGLKTQVFYALQKENPPKKEDLAASFQETALRMLIRITSKMAQKYNLKTLYIGGGVSANQRLRALFAETDLDVFFPLKGLSIDNAAMIAGLGYELYRKKGADSINDLYVAPTNRKALPQLH